MCVAEDCGTVGQAENILKTMGNQNDCDALGAELSSNFVQFFALALGECGCRLIHDQDPGVLGERFCDFHQLLLGNGKRSDRRRGREIRPDTVKKLLRLPVGFSPVDKGPDHEFMPDKNVLSSRKVRIGCGMLIDCGNSMLLCNQGVRHDYFLAVQDDLSSVRLMNSCQRLDEGGLPRTVLSDDGMDFTLFQVEADIVQSRYPWKNLGDMIHFQKIFRHTHASDCCLFT